MQLKVVILVSFLCSIVAADPFLEKKDRAGGLLGLGLLGGDVTTTASTVDTTSAADTTTVAASDSTTAAPSGPVQALLDLLTGVSTVLPIADIASLMGISTDPIPSPFSDPLGFVLHPLITPIIIAAVTLNVPALALAQGALAGNLIMTHLLTQQA